MSGKTYYCWVRVIPATLEGSAFEMGGGDMFMLNGPKRPKGTSTSAGGSDKTSVVWFDSDDVHYGNPKSDLVFDYGPAFADRCLATDWLRDHGRAWAKESRNFFLLEVGPREMARGGNQGDKPAILPTDNSTGVGEYPEYAWPEEYRNMPPPETPLFDPDTIKLTTQPGHAAGECVELLELQRDQRLLCRDKIIEQAQGNNRAIQPVLDVLGGDYAASPDAAAFMHLIMTNIRYVLFRYKVVYGRARPYKKCSDVKPMFMPAEHPLHPAHGSFPAGHAAFAYCWATLLAQSTTDQAKKHRMLDEACNVARNRERAGLHFASDTAAGKELGEKVAAAILRNAEVTSYLGTLFRR